MVTEAIKSGYKKTEIGVIPEDWEIELLQQHLKVKHGKPQKKVYDPKGKYPILASGGEIGRANSYLYNKPSVLIGRKGTIDKPQFMDSPFWTVDTLFYTELFDNTDPKFIFYKFQCIDWYKYNEASGVPSLKASNIERISESFPPSKKEQEAIATVLSDTDELIESLNKLIAKKKDIKQGTMQLLLTGKKRLEGFEGEWEEKELGSFTNIKTGKRNGNEEIPNGAFPFFVRSQKVKKINTYSFDGEAILIPGEGGIGTIIHYIDGKFDYHQRVYKISDFGKDSCAKFIYFTMLKDFDNHAKINSVKATVDSLRLPTFLEFKLKLPPTIQEQKAIADVLSSMDEEIEDLQKERNKYLMIKKGMMQQLLTGGIRLK